MKSLPLAQLVPFPRYRGGGLPCHCVTRIASTAIVLAVAAVLSPSVNAESADGTYVGDVAIDGVSNSDVEFVDGGIVGDGTFVGDCMGRAYGRPDLFYNFYTQGYCNRANAQLYVSPLPVPPNVGHTYYTYQPFYPHHMMYWHKDRYHRYYDNGRGMNRTRATYYSPPVRQTVSNFYWNFLRLPR